MLFTPHGGENYIKKNASGIQHQELHNQVTQNKLLSKFIKLAKQ
jgi:hypothetical protein